jgi:Stress responsive A/B Barrel Domain
METPIFNFTRRSFIRKGSCAGVASLITSGLPDGAEAQSNNASVFHVFLLQWKAGITLAQKDRATKEILAFQGVIPGLLQTHVGPDLSQNGHSFAFGGIMQFKDQASLDAYPKHPAHRALLAWLVPLIDAVELDLRA